jgi:putative NADH-flavin reductase
MNIVLIGATGYVGSALLREALERGHHVTAVVRHPDKLPSYPQLHVSKIDVYDEEAVAKLAAEHDAVLSAFSPGHADPQLFEHHVQGARSIIAGVKRAGVRLLFVGGAGSLEVAPGLQLVDGPDFPAQWKQTALATREVLTLLRREDGHLRWTFLSPAAELVPGDKTGAFRLGGDTLLANAKGESRITLGDYAAAMLDELETPKHTGRRFSVAQ